ncbi:MAG: patatin-like phospholipase [Erysipelotrichaceae bacterium]|nr:MAG: patatin-like [Erysipelotrichaceae bacterium]TXT17707.1 MAG: patatin-like phospholipase [Erysipelotrichaceae bacterium]
MKRKLGLALSGGGIKAYGEVGVYQVFEENEIVFDGFAGTSMGSIIACFLACQLNAAEVREHMLDLEANIIKNKLFKPSNFELLPLVLKQTDGFIKSNLFESLLKTHFDALGYQFISQIPELFVCVATDLMSGKAVIFTNDPKSFAKSKEYIVISDIEIVRALTASCSFPLVFNTTKIMDMQLVDGGIMMNIPVVPLKIMGFEKVVSVCMQDMTEFKESTSMRDIASRIIDIGMHETENWMVAASDLHITIKTKNIGVFSMGKGTLMIEKGYKTAIKMFDQINKIKIQKRRFWL